MEKVRINNDLLVKYTVLRDGQPESFVGATDITVTVTNEAYKKAISNTFDIVGNIVNISIDAADFNLCGKYRVTLKYVRGNDIEIDALAFEGVQFTSLTGGTEIVGVEIVTVNISGDIGINRDGLSAYEVWESYPGNEGKTIEQYFEWLRENPTKVDTSRTISAGNGLTGGGSLTDDITININPSDDSLTVTADNIKVNTIDNVTSTSVTKPLSANQGKVLNDKVVQVETDLNLDEYTIAEAFNLLYRKIVSLETIIANGVFKNLQVDNLTSVNTFNYNGAPLIVIGNTAPSSAPDFVGQTYVNTTAPGTVYSAKGVSSVSDWKQTSN